MHVELNARKYRAYGSRSELASHLVCVCRSVKIVFLSRNHTALDR